MQTPLADLNLQQLYTGAGMSPVAREDPVTMNMVPFAKQVYFRNDVVGDQVRRVYDIDTVRRLPSHPDGPMYGEHRVANPFTRKPVRKWNVVRPVPGKPAATPTAGDKAFRNATFRNAIAITFAWLAGRPDRHAYLEGAQAADKETDVEMQGVAGVTTRRGTSGVQARFMMRNGNLSRNVNADALGWVRSATPDKVKCITLREGRLQQTIYPLMASGAPMRDAMTQEPIQGKYATATLADLEPDGTVRYLYQEDPEDIYGHNPFAPATGRKRVWDDRIHMSFDQLV